MEIEVGLQYLGDPYARTVRFAVGSMLLTVPVVVALTATIGVLAAVFRRTARRKTRPDNCSLWLDVPWAAAAAVSIAIAFMVMVFVVSGNNRHMLPQFLHTAMWGQPEAAVVEVEDAVEQTYGLTVVDDLDGLPAELSSFGPHRVLVAETQDGAVQLCEVHLGDGEHNPRLSETGRAHVDGFLLCDGQEPPKTD